MNVDEALRQFVEAEELPRAAMQWALDHWDEASPRFVARLRAFAAAAARSENGHGRTLLHRPSLRRKARRARLCAAVPDDRRRRGGERFSRRRRRVDVERHSHQRLRRRSGAADGRDRIAERRRIRARGGARGARLSRARPGRPRRRRNARLSQAIAPRNEAARPILPLGGLGGDGRQSRLRRSAPRRRNIDQGPASLAKANTVWPTSTNR